MQERHNSDRVEAGDPTAREAEPLQRSHVDLAAGWHERQSRMPSLWHLLRTPSPFDPVAVRAACTVLFVAYGSIVSVIPLAPSQFWTFWCARGAVLVYAALGVILARRLTPGNQRLYAFGLALLLPLTTSYMEGLRGNDIGQVAFTALTTFIPLVFLNAGWDFVLVDVLLVIGNALLFRVLPPPAMPVLSVWVLILGAIGTGTAAGLILVIYRALTNESLAWWKETYARERTLREFAESATQSPASGALLDAIAARFQATLPDSCCVLFLADGETQPLRLAAVAGLEAEARRTVSRTPPPPALVALWNRLERAGQPLGQAQLGDAQLLQLGRALHVPFAIRGLVALPLVGFVRGIVLLAAPEPCNGSEDELLMWQAMTRQAAIMVANAHAWERLRDEGVRARRLAEERAAVAEMKARFVSQASHEFRTPLTVIAAASDVVKRYGDRLTPAQIAERMERIRGAARQMTELLEDVLTLGRAEAGKALCLRQPGDVLSICQGVAADVRATAPTHRLECRSGAVGSAMLDPKLIQQILRNLLGNAIKYSPDGSEVALEVERHDGAVVFRVRDHGIGILPDDQAHIFEAFQRGANVGTIGGTGLGLAITHKAVELHGGTIAMESEVGCGTMFVVTLPDAELETPRAMPAAHGDDTPHVRAW